MAGRPAARAGTEIKATPHPSRATDLKSTLVQLLEFRDDGNRSTETGIPYSVSDYQDLVDWSGRAILEGKRGSVPDSLPPILKRRRMRPEQYLARSRKPGFGIANALSTLDKLKEYAERFGKAFLKGQIAAAALFSPSP